MKSQRKGMVSVESLMVIAVGTIILLGLTQHWETSLRSQTERAVGVVLGQEEELVLSKQKLPKEPLPAPKNRHWDAFWNSIAGDSRMMAQAIYDFADSSLFGLLKKLIGDPQLVKDDLERQLAVKNGVKIVEVAESLVNFTKLLRKVNEFGRLSQIWKNVEANEAWKYVDLDKLYKQMDEARIGKKDVFDVVKNAFQDAFNSLSEGNKEKEGVVE